MSNIRARILLEITRQATHEGETANLRVCRAALERVQSVGDWQALVSVQFHRYGPRSYEAYRFYYVRGWAVALIADCAEGELRRTISCLKTVPATAEKD